MTQARTHGRTPPFAGKPAEATACRTQDAIGRQLDAELDQSFPASDPPSMLRDAPAAICHDAEPPPAGKTPGGKTPGGKALRGKRRHADG